MVALSLWRDGRCDGCNGRLDETLEHEDWEALPPLRCHRCKVLAIAQERFEDKHPHTLRWSAKRRGW